MSASRRSRAGKHGGSLAGTISLTAGLRRMGAGWRLRTRYLDELADSLDDAVERALAAKRDRRAVSIDLQANAADVLPELLRRGFEADIVTDHTSAHAARA